MGNSLQDQLLKAGLVDEQRHKQAKTAKRRKRSKGKGQEQDEGRLRARQEAVAKAQRDRAIEKERQAAARRKAEQHELRQLIHSHRLLRGEGDQAFNFQDGDALKRIYVTADQRKALVSGGLGLVRQDENYELVPREIAERVRSRDAALVLVLNVGDEDGPGTADDDPYADYRVPDDLTW